VPILSSSEARVYCGEEGATVSRYRLHVSKLEDFATWLERIGWTRAEVKGDYEVLRMTRIGSKPLIVHTKLATARGNAPVHLTLHGVAEQMFSNYMRSSREPPRNKNDEAWDLMQQANNDMNEDVQL
jgi:hypothetical protein